jgi:hypothetical protein
LFEQGYKGHILFDGYDVRGGTNASLSGTLRLELLLGKWVGLGVEGNAGTFRMGAESIPFLVAGDGTVVSLEPNDGRHFVGGTYGFVRLRFGLNSGRGEYYFIGGGGPAFMRNDENDPNQYGMALSGNSDVGWTAYARFGIRGEILPGLGALLEIGWLHREHLEAFTQPFDLVGTPVIKPFDYVINQVSFTVGWYLAR